MQPYVCIYPHKSFTGRPSFQQSIHLPTASSIPIDNSLVVGAAAACPSPVRDVNNNGNPPPSPRRLYQYHRQFRITNADVRRTEGGGEAHQGGEKEKNGLHLGLRKSKK